MAIYSTWNSQWPKLQTYFVKQWAISTLDSVPTSPDMRVGHSLNLALDKLASMFEALLAITSHMEKSACAFHIMPLYAPTILIEHELLNAIPWNFTLATLASPVLAKQNFY
jgi:hypothetical protein